jgi:hypothetical protein
MLLLLLLLLLLLVPPACATQADIPLLLVPTCPWSSQPSS